MDESALPEARHEPTDVSPAVIWIGAPALILAVIGLALLVLALFPARAVDLTLHLPLPHFPNPQLQVNPRQDMEQFRAAKLRWLEGTGWIDPAHGIAHIPIEDAMREVAKEGIPGWPEAPSPRTDAAPSGPGTSGGRP
jgi:hypothetical protein